MHKWMYFYYSWCFCWLLLFYLQEKIAQLEEVKQASIKQIQDAIELEKSQQALVQKRHYLFDVQRVGFSSCSGEWSYSFCVFQKKMSGTESVPKW